MLVLTSESAIQDAERKISTGRGWHTESHGICYKRKGRKEENDVIKSNMLQEEERKKGRKRCDQIEYATRERRRKEERGCVVKNGD